MTQRPPDWPAIIHHATTIAHTALRGDAVAETKALLALGVRRGYRASAFLGKPTGEAERERRRRLDQCALRTPQPHDTRSRDVPRVRARTRPARTRRALRVGALGSVHECVDGPRWSDMPAANVDGCRRVRTNGSGSPPAASRRRDIISVGGSAAPAVPRWSVHGHRLRTRYLPALRAAGELTAQHTSRRVHRCRGRLLPEHTGARAPWPAGRRALSARRHPHSAYVDADLLDDIPAVE